MRIIGLSAKARHGKDTCAKLIQEIAKEDFGKNVGGFPFALPLKARVYAELQGRYTWEDINVTKPQEVRQMLQQVGTEKGRNVFGIEFWMRQTRAFLSHFEVSMPFMDGVAIPDVRFPNEVTFAKYGGQIQEDLVCKAMDEALQVVGLTKDLESELLLYDYSRLEQMDREALDYAAALLKLQRTTGTPSLSLYIQSDRPTLEGEFALHPSETSLDHLDKNVHFDGIITNNLDTTLDDLKEQLRPFVKDIWGK